ncbi:MAG: hypothetical protein QXG16_03385 [Candidatus Anstonellaceae archaeon]
MSLVVLEKKGPTNQQKVENSAKFCNNLWKINSNPSTNSSFFNFISSEQTSSNNLPKIEKTITNPFSIKTQYGNNTITTSSQISQFSIEVPKGTTYELSVARGNYTLFRELSEKFDYKKAKTNIQESEKTFPYFVLFSEILTNTSRFLIPYSTINEILEELKNMENNNTLFNPVSIGFETHKAEFKVALEKILRNLNMDEDTINNVLYNFEKGCSNYVVVVSASAEIFPSQKHLPSTTDPDNLTEKDKRNLLDYNKECSNKNENFAWNLANEYGKQFGLSPSITIPFYISFDGLKDNNKLQETIDVIDIHTDVLRYIVSNYDNISKEEASNYSFSQLQRILNSRSKEEVLYYSDLLIEELEKIKKDLLSSDQKIRERGFYGLQIFLEKISAAKRFEDSPPSSEYKRLLGENYTHYVFFNDLLNITARGFVISPSKEKETLISVEITYNGTEIQQSQGPEKKSYISTTSKFSVKLNPGELIIDQTFFEELVRQMFIDLNPGSVIAIKRSSSNNLEVEVKKSTEVKTTDVGDFLKVYCPKTLDPFKMDSEGYLVFSLSVSPSIKSTGFREEYSSSSWNLSGIFNFLPNSIYALTLVGVNSPQEIGKRKTTAKCVNFSHKLLFGQELSFFQSWLSTYFFNSFQFETFVLDSRGNFVSYEKYREEIASYLQQHILEDINFYEKIGKLNPDEAKNLRENLKSFSFTTFDTLPPFLKEEIELTLDFAYYSKRFSITKNNDDFNKLSELYQKRIDHLINAIAPSDLDKSFLSTQAVLLLQNITNLALNNGLTLSFEKNLDKNNSLGIKISMFSQPFQNSLKGTDPTFPIPAGVIQTPLGPFTSSAIPLALSGNFWYKHTYPFDIFQIPANFSISASLTGGLIFSYAPTSHEDQKLLYYSSEISNKFSELLNALKEQPNSAVASSTIGKIEELSETINAFKRYASEKGYRGLVEYADRILEWLDKDWLRKNFNVDIQDLNGITNQNYLTLIRDPLSGLVGILTAEDGLISTFFGKLDYSDSAIKTGFYYGFDTTPYGFFATLPPLNLIKIGGLNLFPLIASQVAAELNIPQYELFNNFYASATAKIAYDPTSVILLFMFYPKAKIRHRVSGAEAKLPPTPIPLPIEYISLNLSYDFTNILKKVIPWTPPMVLNVNPKLTLFGYYPQDAKVESSLGTSIGPLNVHISLTYDWSKLGPHSTPYFSSSLGVGLGYEQNGIKAGLYWHKTDGALNTWWVGASFSIPLYISETTKEIPLSEEELNKYPQTKLNFSDLPKDYQLYLNSVRVEKDGKTFYKLGSEFYDLENALKYIEERKLIYNYLSSDTFREFLGLELPPDTFPLNPLNPVFIAKDKTGNIRYLSVEESIELLQTKLEKVTNKKFELKEDTTEDTTKTSTKVSKLLPEFMQLTSFYGSELLLIYNGFIPKTEK